MTQSALQKSCRITLVSYMPPLLFFFSEIRAFEDIISVVDLVISTNVNMALTRSVTTEEIKLAAFQMGPLKAPGSDGFLGFFYQKYWQVVGEDVCSAVKNFFEGGYLLKEMNHTNITLIPKVAGPESMSQFRRISLCRYNYKII